MWWLVFSSRMWCSVSLRNPWFLGAGGESDGDVSYSELSITRCKGHLSSTDIAFRLWSLVAGFESSYVTVFVRKVLYLTT